MFPALEDIPLPRLSVFAAMLAAIMLVIGGAPVRAAADPCNPCPPDCAMMKAQAEMAQHQKAPAKAPADSPCKSMAACAVGFAMPVMPESLTLAAFDPTTVRQPLRNELREPSRPPDRNLRPPIQL